MAQSFALLSYFAGDPGGLPGPAQAKAESKKIQKIFI
jgi:hypothetical protein